MEKGSKVTNYLKNTMQVTLRWSGKSMVGSSAVVPALAPIPINEVDTSYGSLDPIDLNQKKIKKNIKKL